MKGKTARILWAVCIVGGTIGFCAEAGPSVTDFAAEKEVMVERVSDMVPGPSPGTVVITGADGADSPAGSDRAGRTGSTREPEDTEAFREDMSLYGGQAGQQAKEAETPGEPVPAAGRQVSGTEERDAVPPRGIPLSDTVEYVPSGRKEIMETGYVKTVVDEKDPGTYQEVEREQKIPVKYVDDTGAVRYFYENGVWYEYKYSNGDIALDEKNQELALRFLNLKGAYDGYEIVQVDCTEKRDENGGMQYEYHVRYRRAEVMESSPAQIARETPGGIGRAVEFMTVKVREKIPVIKEVRTGTGEYEYYGWQVLDGNTFYFDKNGEKVTGIQVIQGVCHVFDENGVKISRAGIDVSEKNGEIDWGAVTAEGVDFAMIRCRLRGEGDALTAGTRTEEQIRAAQAAGVETGICLVMQASTEEEAVREAEAAVLLAQRYGIDGPVAVCCAGADPTYTRGTDGLDTAHRTACVRAFCQRIRDGGYEPLIRAEAGWLASDMLWLEELKDCGLWLSQYDSGISNTGPCTFREYTAEGTVNGVNGYTGLIISYGK